MIDNELISLSDALLNEVRSGNLSIEGKRKVAENMPVFYNKVSMLFEKMTEINNKSVSVRERIVDIRKINSKNSQNAVIVTIGIVTILGVIFPKLINQYFIALIGVLSTVLLGVISYKFYFFKEIKNISNELVTIDKDYEDIKFVLDHIVKNLDEISTVLSAKEE